MAGIFSSGSKYTKADDQAKVITPPRSSIVRDISTTVDIIQIPAAWTNKWLTLTAIDNNAYFLTGKTSSFVATLSLVATPAPAGVPTLQTNTPAPMPNGVPIQFYFDATDDAFIAVVGKVGAGQWFLTPSSPSSGG